MKPTTALLVMFPLVLVAAAFVLVATRGAGAGPLQDGVFWDAEVARFIRHKVAHTYVDELDEERAAHAFARAMDAYLHDLDEYCDYIPPKQYRRWKEETTGEYAGMGVKVRDVDEGLEIVGILPGGPAARAGLHHGDVIVAADGKPLADVELIEIETRRLLKGESGSTVVLTLLPGPRPPEGEPWAPKRHVAVVRAVIRPPTVFSRRVGPDGCFGVIRLDLFAEATGEDFDEALRKMLADDVKGLVLDLRGNHGGVLPTAVSVVDRFVDRGVIVRMEGRAPRSNRMYEAKPDATVSATIPLVVLVDGGSASASEVVAGALQDHRRAVLVGERTYGKFLVQQITDIPDHESALQLTTSRYYLPSGRSYQRSRWKERSSNGTREGRQMADDPAGILPDVVVPLNENEQARLEKSWGNAKAVPWGEEKPWADVADDYVDPQLGRAIELLQGQVVLRRIRGVPGSPQPR